MYYARLLAECSFSSLVSWRICVTIIVMERHMPKTSEIGPAYNAPSMPKILGSRIIIGIRKSNCRVKEENMLSFAFPMEVKKFVVTFSNPYKNVKNI